MSERKKVDPANVYISGTSELQPDLKKSAEDLSETEAGQRIATARDFFEHLDRSMKTIGIYRHNTSHYGEYLDKTWRALEIILEQEGTLALKVDQLAFKYLDVPIYEGQADDQNIAYRFYRDGVRILIFRQGLTAEELLNWVLICMTNFRAAEHIHEDIVSLMWKQEFSNIEYVVVESVSVGGEGEDEAKIDVDKIVNYLYKRMTSKSKDRFHFARVSLEDLEIELDDVEQAKGVLIKGTTATDADKTKVQAEIEEEDENRMLPKLVVILFKVLEEELDQDLGQSIEEVFIQLLDSMLMHEDFRGINQILRKFKGIHRKNLPAGNQARIEKIEENFTARMGEAERIGRIGEILETTGEIKKPQEVYRYLTRLGDAAILPLLDTLERMEKQDPRRLFCDALAVLGKDHLDVFSRRLQSTKSNVVRDMLYIIDKLNPPDKLKLMAQLLKHPNLAIRIEALNTIGAGNDKSCRIYVLNALNDPDTQMRMTAARLLPNFNIKAAVKTLFRIVNDSDFHRKPAKEQSAIFSALAMTDLPEAMEFFRRQLRSTSLLSKKKLAEYKRNIVNGLGLSGSITAYKLLKTELEAGIKEEDVAAQAKRICGRLREKLLGS
jgi:HEAT repeat protein